jgi:hypothetical protein
MRDQQSIKPYKSPIAPMQEGAVPVQGREATAFARDSALRKSPLPVTPARLEEGRLSYDYYCMMCHGADGLGNGPVGEGCVPKPKDLRSSGVQALTDGALYRRMLTGPGHDPVLRDTVPLDARWKIVMHVRTLLLSTGKEGARWQRMKGR